jgi:hypothetical protein
MGIPDPLRQAAVTVPRWATSEAGATVADAVEYLDHNSSDLPRSRSRSARLGRAFSLGYLLAAATALVRLRVPRCGSG